MKQNNVDEIYQELEISEKQIEEGEVMSAESSLKELKEKYLDA